MELLFYWIAEHKKLEDISFNFSPRYNITFELDKKLLTIEPNKNLLTIKKDENVLENFWGNPAIKNVTLFLGKNGSGKTSALESLYSPYLRNGIDYFPAIYVFEKVESGQKSIVVFTPVEPKIKIGCKEISYQEIELKPDPNIRELHSHFKDIVQIFYSPVFRGEVLNGRFDDYYNISSDAILHRSLNNSFLNRFYEYKTQETYKQCLFLARFENKLGDILNDINLVQLQISPIVYDTSDIVFKGKEKVRVLKFLYNQDSQLAEKAQTTLNKNDIKELFIYRCIFGLIQEFLKFSTRPIDITRNLSKAFLEVSTIIEIYEKALLLLSDKDRERTQNKKLPRKIREFVEQHIDKLITDNPRFPYMSFFPIDKEDLTNLKPLLELKEETPAYFNFSIIGLSSGELYILSLFSRLYELKFKVEYNEKGILLLLDEGEITLHPEWQRRYLDSILTLVPQIFKNKTIQIVLTSNNPIVASDFPKENIIFLDKDIGIGKTKISPKENHKETFGANIATLLQDSFFLEGGFIGEFAKKKIEKLIERIKAKTEDVKELEREINLIGEPLIRNRLRDMLGIKPSVEKQIEDLEKQIERLKGLENDKN